MKNVIRMLICGGMVMAAPTAVPAAEPLPSEVLTALRIVEDPEGTANVRSGPSAQSKVLEQLPVGTVIAIDPESTGEWVKLWSHTTADPTRYVHSSRLRKVEHWKQVPGRVLEEVGVAGADGFEVRVKGEPFLAAKHRISKDKEGQHLVDGKSPWGVDGGLPTVTLTWTASLHGQPLRLPPAATDNLFQPNPESIVLLTPGKASAQAVVVMLNSDGAGGYCVAWSFKDGRYCGREVFMPF